MADSYHQECVQNESKAFDAELKCFLCLENVFKCNTLNAEVGADLTSPGVSSGIKIEGSYGDVAAEKIPLRSICRYLGIIFQQILTGDGEKLPSDKISADGTFCNQCFSIVSPLSALCNQLELLQMKVDYFLKAVVEVAERFSRGPQTNSSIDGTNQKFAQLLRIEIRKKGQVKLNQAFPKVELVKISSAQLRNNFINATPSSEKKIDTDVQNVSPLKLASEATKNISPHVRKPTEGKSTQKEFKCNVCGKHFKYASTFYKHKKIGHDEEGKPNVIKCEICGKVYTAIYSLIMHKKVIHEGVKDNVECEICGKLFNLRRNLIRHKKGSHEGVKDNFKCEICNKMYSSRCKLMRHKKRSHDGVKDNFKCEICNKTYSSRYKLIRHKKVIHEGVDNSFKCDICSRVFRWKSSLQNHEKLVHNQGTLNPHVCKVCGKVFKNFPELYKHRKLGHDKEGKPNAIKCGICGKVFNTESCLMAHKKAVHDSVKDNLKCETCGKVYTFRKNLMRHKKWIHEGFNANFKCEICNKTYSSRYKLTLHKQIIHEGVNNNFKCEVCGKVFSWRCNLRTHVKLVHTKQGAVSPRVCKVCGKVYRGVSNFYKHMKLGHDEEGKPNVLNCEICGKAFTKRDNLMEHKKVIHEGARSKCDSCGKVFLWKSNLWKHVKTKHQINMSNGRVSKGVDFDKTNLKSEESEPDVKVYILPKFTEEHDIEHPVEGSQDEMHLNTSANSDGMKEEEDHFYTEYVNPGVSSNYSDHFDCLSEEIQAEMKIVPD